MSEKAKYLEALSNWHTKRRALETAKAEADQAWKDMKRAADNLHINTLREADREYYNEHQEDRPCLTRL